MPDAALGSKRAEDSQILFVEAERDLLCAGGSNLDLEIL